MNRITRLAVTGGPCGGKSEAIKTAARYFEKKGKTVITVPETATELISHGISPWTLSSKYTYQLLQMRLQLAKEEVFYEAAKNLTGDNEVILIHDRSVPDCMAYMGKKDYYRALFELGKDQAEILSGFFAVFHMTSAAKADFYTTQNNSSRTETPDEAAALDDLILHAWEAHNRRIVVPCFDDFGEKTDFLIGEMEKIL